jgi:hypothetical protein
MNPRYHGRQRLTVVATDLVGHCVSSIEAAGVDLRNRMVTVAARLHPVSIVRLRVVLYMKNATDEELTRHDPEAA